MARQREAYTAEFKLAAVKMSTDQKLSVAEVARRFGVAEGRLHEWNQLLGESGSAAE